jgi:hypothetical protein
VILTNVGKCGGQLRIVGQADCLLDASCLHGRRRLPCFIPGGFRDLAHQRPPVHVHAAGPQTLSQACAHRQPAIRTSPWQCQCTSCHLSMSVQGLRISKRQVHPTAHNMTSFQRCRSACKPFSWCQQFLHRPQQLSVRARTKPVFITSCRVPHLLSAHHFEAPMSSSSHMHAACPAGPSKSRSRGSGAPWVWG